MAKTRPPQNRFFSRATQHGIDNEDVAIAKFEKTYGKKVFEFGLLPHPHYNWLGASPDGICASGEMVEVKCPFKRPILAAEDYPLGCPKHYYGQVQLQLECADLDECYFIQYRPENLFNEEALLVTTVKRDRVWWAEKFPTMKQFWQDVVAFRTNHPEWETVDVYEKQGKIRKRKKNADLETREEKRQKIKTFDIGMMESVAAGFE